MHNSERGGVPISVLYNKQIHRDDKIRWRCVQRSKDCAGILQTTVDDEDPNLQKEHNHALDPTMIEVKKRLNEMKTKALDTHEKPSQIFAQVAEQVQVNYILVSLKKYLFRKFESGRIPRVPEVRLKVDAKMRKHRVIYKKTNVSSYILYL